MDKNMIVAFFHDAPLYEDVHGDIYSLGFPYEIWQRYISVFNKLIVCTRKKIFNATNESTRKGLRMSSGDNVDFYPVNRYSGGIKGIFQYRNVASEVRQALDKADCAIIRLPSVIGLIGCREAIKMKKPWAVEFVACPWDAYWNHGTIAGKMIAPAMYLLNRHYVREVSHAIYVSEQFLQERYPANGIQASCSNVNIPEVSEEVLQERLLKIERCFQNRNINFGLIGSLNVDFKGHETAIRALAAIKNKIPPFKLRFLGGGSSEKWQTLAEKYGIANNIEFCGTLPSGEPVMNWIDETDIYLIPSLQEGLPRALVEAMSRGCPALGAYTGGIPELLQQECLHKKKDWQKLSADITRLVNDSNMLKKYAVENFNIAKNYTKDVLDKRRNEFWTNFRSYVEHYQ